MIDKFAAAKARKPCLWSRIELVNRHGAIIAQM